jgi:purine nucleosidase
MACWAAWAAGCAGAGEEAPAEIASEVQAIESDHARCGGRAVPVVFDTDMDFDDTAALAYLSQQHKLGRIELRAVTVANNGAGFAGSAIRHARCVLAEFGLSHIPVADGAPTGANSFSPVLRFGVEQILNDTMASCGESAASSAVPAERVLADAISSSARPVTVFTSGTLTNLSNALTLLEGRRRGAPFANISRVVIMGGAVRVAGNVEPGATADGSQEVNLWADPAASRSVFSRVGSARVTLVPLDATNHAPVTSAYLARLAADHHTAEAHYVARLMAHPFIAGGVAAGAPIFWWDPLAAMAVTAATSDGVLTFAWTRVEVLSSGLQQGRTVERTSGRAWARVAFSADTAAFEDDFLAALNGRR